MSSGLLFGQETHYDHHDVIESMSYTPLDLQMILDLTQWIRGVLCLETIDLHLVYPSTMSRFVWPVIVAQTTFLSFSRLAGDQQKNEVPLDICVTV
jgi:hypothetical protein